jgi:sugar (pentulose or hexulose) kinase
MTLTLPTDALIAGYDFSTGGVKVRAFDLAGNTVAVARLPTDLWTEGGVSELNLMQLEGQARAGTRALVRELGSDAKRLAAIGVSATHHTAGRIDAAHNQVRRAICWNDQTLAAYHAEGLARQGGQERVRSLVGGPWAVRYSLSHLVKDAHQPEGHSDSLLPRSDWERTTRILPHGPLAAGYLTGRFDCTSVSSAASTGIMNLATEEWCRPMLEAIAQPNYRELAWKSLPAIIGMYEPIGPVAEHLALDAGLPPGVRPLVYPTLDDQAAGLIGGGAVKAGQVAIILGNSAVVNSSADRPAAGSLDVMKLNWGPYLWMRCYTNGAQFLDGIVGANRSATEWSSFTASAEKTPPLCNGVGVLPFAFSEPSIGVTQPRVEWYSVADGGTIPAPAETGVRVRAAFEAISYLIALGVRAHEEAGQSIEQITVSGGIARNELMVRVLASVLNRPLQLLKSDEGTALGAAVVALAGAETSARQTRGRNEVFTALEAARLIVAFRGTVTPEERWVAEYRRGLAAFEKRI